ncbi:Zinc finger, FYVE/PHD-type [Penicillium italicum]|uniref:Zinc finger, FYVE/PHD-type n=1 Tax=Penicillium italicum TaxID=40296 RepID=A0A0A2KBR2_PENIT|nr:Zinc finger, FYVE/PHD-type [Penicillium italicum]
MTQDSQPEEKPEGFSKYLERMTIVLHARSTTPAEVAPAKTTAPKATSSPAPALELEPAQELSPPGPVMITNYSKTQLERARTLFAKYGLTVDTSEWKTSPDPQLTRVTKPIRMRVRRTCHRCDTTFGAEKVCINCQHTRCTKCPRYPTARNKDHETSTRSPKLPETYVHQPRLIPRTSHLKLSTTKEIPIKMPSLTGGQDLVHRLVHQRIHRYCHLCTTILTPGSKECPSCIEERCKTSPRDTAKLEKYPDGYANDTTSPKLNPERTFRKPRRRVHYECHVCETWFQGNANTCAKCGQAKCDKTKRFPVKPETSPPAPKKIEEKFAAMALERKQDIGKARA